MDLMLFTKDKETARYLQKEGFALVNKNNDGWTFVSTGNQMEHLSKKDMEKIAVTDKLCI